MALESKTFFDVVEKHGLVSEKQLSNLKEAVKKDSLSDSDLKTLVARKYLTQWQAQRLLAGKHNFKVGNYRLLDYLGKDKSGEVYLVEPLQGEGKHRLRLLSRELCDQPSKLEQYRGRVQSFQNFANQKITPIVELSDVGGRTIVVTECPQGQSLVKLLAGKPQNAKLVEKLLEKVGRLLGDLESAGARHGAINGHSIALTDKQKIALDLPSDIGFLDAPKNKSESDIASLGWVGCGLLSGDFEKPQISGTALADSLFEIASKSDAGLEQLLQAIGVKSDRPPIDSVILEVDADTGAISVAGVKPLAGGAEPGDSAKQGAVEGIPQIITGEESLPEASGADQDMPVIVTPDSPAGGGEPAAVNLSEIRVQDGNQPSDRQEAATQATPDQETPDSASNEEVLDGEPVEDPAVPEDPFVIPEVPNVTAEGLESFSKKDEMFGNLDNVEIVSELQTSQNLNAIASLAVDAAPAGSPSAAQAQARMNPTAPPAEESAEKPTGNARMLLIGVLAGSVGAVSIGLVIYFLAFAVKDTQLASKPGNQAESVQPDRDQVGKSGKGAEYQKDYGKKEPGNDENGVPDEPNGTGGVEKRGSGLFNFGKKKTIGSGPLPGTPQDSDDKTTPDQGKNENGGLTGTGESGNPPGKPQIGLQPKNPAGKVIGSPGISGLPQTGKKNPAEKDGSNPAQKTGDGNGLMAGKNGPSEKGPAKKDSEPGGKKKDDAIILVGTPKKKDDDSKEKGGENSTVFPNPFAQAPHFVSLVPARKGAPNAAAQKLFPLTIPKNLPLTVKLHGGDRASKAKIEFTLKASTSANATWSLSAGAKGAGKIIANLTFDGKHLVFAWNREATNTSNAIYLQNCALEIQASRYRHLVALRAPVIATKLDFSKSLNPIADAKLDNLPNMENVKTVLVSLPKKLARFEYTKNRNFLLGRADTTELHFKKENIDVARGILANRLRGSRMTVNLSMHYITPDKTVQKMTNYGQFEKDYGKFVSEAENLQLQYNNLMKRFNATPDNLRAAFSRQTGKVEMEKQIKAAKQLKQHLANTSEVMKTFQGVKIGIRIFYQAGEHQVDLATPDGKKFFRSQPPQQPAAKPGQKAKKKKK